MHCEQWCSCAYHTTVSAHFTMVQFAAQALFLIAIIAISVIGDLGTVMTAQVGQGVNVVWSALFFYLGWRLLTAMPANHPLPEGRSLFTQGFYQVVHTIKDINKRYRRGLRWFLLAVVFAEAAANAFTVVAVIYLDEQIGLSSNGIAAFFLTTLIASLPGSKLGQWVTHRSDPNKSWQLCMLCLFLWSAGGAVVVDHVPKEVSFVWGAGVGVLLGWFYPVEGLFFSMCLPKGQEAVRRLWWSLYALGVVSHLVSTTGTGWFLRLLHANSWLATSSHIHATCRSQPEPNIRCHCCHRFLLGCHCVGSMRGSLGGNPRGERSLG